jgi:hypothetical protein
VHRRRRREGHGTRAPSQLERGTDERPASRREAGDVGGRGMIEPVDAARGVEQSLREDDGVVAPAEHDRQKLDVGARGAARREKLRAHAVHATRR